MSPIPDAIAVVLGELTVSMAHREELYSALHSILKEAKRSDISHDGESVLIRVHKEPYKKARRALLRHIVSYEVEQSYE